MKKEAVKLLITAVIMLGLISEGFGQNLTYGTSQRSEKAAKVFRIIGLVMQIGCEVTLCNEQRQYGSEQVSSANYPVSSNYPTSNTGGSDTYGGGSSQAEGVYSLAPTMSSVPRYQLSGSGVTSPSTALKQDQPSSGLRARVQWAINRLRQLRAAIRGIRFHRSGPLRWECEVNFKLPWGPEGVCRIKADGTIEGLP